MRTLIAHLSEALRLIVMPREVALDSRAIEAVRYERERRALIVRFRGGHPYEYGCVPPRIYRRLLRADSKGGFFSREIRDRYPFRRLAG